MRADPIRCFRPAPDKASTFASLPYDVFDRAQAASYVKAHPGSFLAIDRPETSFSPDHDMYAPDVRQGGRAYPQRGCPEGTLLRDDTPCATTCTALSRTAARRRAWCAPAPWTSTSTAHPPPREHPSRGRSRTAWKPPSGDGRDRPHLPDVPGQLRHRHPAPSCVRRAAYDYFDEYGVRQCVWRGPSGCGGGAPGHLRDREHAYIARPPSRRLRRPREPGAPRAGGRAASPPEDALPTASSSRVPSPRASSRSWRTTAWWRTPTAFPWTS